MFYYIFSIVLYFAGAYGFGRFVKNYLHELEARLCEMGYTKNRWDIYIRMTGPSWLKWIKLFFGGIFWPVSVIAILLRAEWKFSQITQP